MLKCGAHPRIVKVIRREAARYIFQISITTRIKDRWLVSLREWSGSIACSSAIAVNSEIDGAMKPGRALMCANGPGRSRTTSKAPLSGAGKFTGAIPWRNQGHRD